MTHLSNGSNGKEAQRAHPFNGSNRKEAHLLNRRNGEALRMAHLFNGSNGEAPEMAQKAHLFSGQAADVFNGSNGQVADNFKGKSVVKRSKQMDVDQAMGIHFQEEIIVEILIRLPVRSIRRFKCVSKSWMALISDPYFKMKHLNHAKNNLNSQKLLVSRAVISYFTSGYFYIYSLSSFPRVGDVYRLDCPTNRKPFSQTPYCCYDGLSLIEVSDSPECRRVVLWNPSIRESVVLPPPELPETEYCTWGLGYDSSTDDYKILKICHQVCSEILALKSGSWRKIDAHPTGIHPVLSGMDSLAFVHGAFHWLGMSLNYSLVSFNISSEAYGEIPLPQEMRLICCEEYTKSGVFVLREMLCCYSTNIHEKEGKFKLWLMKDYGVEKSWNIGAVIVCPGLDSAIPKYKAPDGELLFYATTPGAPIHCGFRTLEGPYGLQHLPRHEGFAYTESLISPNYLLNI